MENPATWDRATRVVADALAHADRAQAEGYVGLSTAGQIVHALREAGLLRDKDETSA